MFKLRNFKILLLLMLFAFAGQSAWADKGDTKYSYYVAYNKVQVNKTGAGLVYTQEGTKNFDANFNSKKDEVFRYASKSNESATSCTEIVDKQSAKFTFYMQAEEKEGYKFVRWINDAGEEVSTQKYCAVEVITTNYCGEYTEAESKDTSVWNNPQENNPNYYDALYTAVFEPLVKDPLIKVRSNNTNLGMTTITHEDNSNAVENDIGDDVVLFAYTVNYDKKFLGWQKNGEIVSRENPWHMQVSEENAGEYTAVFDDGYKFCRMKNFGTEHRYITAVNDEGGLDDLTAIQLEDSFDDMIANAGSVIEIYTETTYVPIPDGEGTKKVTYHDFKVQNSSGVDKGYYDFSAGKYLRMPHYTKFFDEGTWAFSQADITYNEEGKKTGLRFRDKNGNASFASLTNDPYSQWYIEPMDKDLETKENYFSLDPDKLVEVDGKYYTTLRTSWNILFNPEQMTPYIVKSVDETAGTFEMEAISGNIIPAGTPVIIETKSNVVEENRMVPTTTAAASDVVPSGNLLQHSEKYFPNQAAPVANCKGLIKNADGQLAFGGNALTTVNGNEAYLSVASEVVLPKPIETVTLAQLCADGFEGRPYCIKDSLLIVYSKDNSIWVKDNNKSICKDIYNGEQLYLIGRETGSEMPPNQVPQNEYDQSNWLEVQLTGTDNYEVTQSIGYYVNANAIKGTFSNKLSPTMTGVKLQRADIIDADEAVNYNANYYCPASFFGSQQGAVASVQHNYFFVKPKPQELANVVWAMWNNTEQKMVLHGDKHGFQGKFRIDMELNNDPTFVPADNTAYNFLAIIRKQELRDIGYMVYPLNISSSVITAVTDIAAKQVVGVTYYNVSGLSSKRPFEGVNIVVTRYSDGSRSAVKVVK